MRERRQREIMRLAELLAKTRWEQGRFTVGERAGSQASWDNAVNVARQALEDELGRKRLGGKAERERLNDLFHEYAAQREDLRAAEIRDEPGSAHRARELRTSSEKIRMEFMNLLGEVVR